MRIRSLAVASAIALASFVASAAQVDVAQYVKPSEFGEIKLSPNGDYYAAVAMLERKSSLVIVSRATGKPTAHFTLGDNKYVRSFDWVNPRLVMLTMNEKIGALDTPLATGNLYTVDAEGKGVDILVGQDVEAMQTGSHITVKKQEQVAAFLIDDLRDDEDYVLISTQPFNGDAYPQVERMDVGSGKRKVVVRSPVRNAAFVTDHHGVVRFAHGHDMSSDNKLFYRKADGSEWQELNDERSGGHDEWAIGFSADDATAYLEVEQAAGPNAIVAMDTATGKRTEVFRDKAGDPRRYLFSRGAAVGGVPVGVEIMDGKPRTAFFDKGGADEMQYRSLERAFAGQEVIVSSKSNDGNLMLVEVSSDRNPGDFYLFDAKAKKADLLGSRKAWFDPESMAEVRPFTMAARDGLPLQGYLTIPHGSNGRDMPMVLLPHGGPIGVAEAWHFDSEAQMLAAAGYVVLQLDYRGSGFHGRSFLDAGKRQWGGKMQDDVTDAARWAIGQGIADPQRICIYGASYGAYAALEGAAKEPTLYKCAVGYVGVYDLPLTVSHTAKKTASGEAWDREWIGEASQLAAASPVNQAASIKVPVLLAAGGQDLVAPIEHSERMEKALRDAGVPVETLYVRTEGHGFYTQEHQVQFYTKLLDFLGRNIGAGTAVDAHASAAAAN
jgi:dipeptidyl aminopeptidase/acylaminoacyl peptidase